MKINSSDLQKKIKNSQSIIRQAAELYPAEKIAVAWTGGKDSTVVLHLIRSVFNATIPFPVMFNDSTMEFEEVYSFIETLTEQWKIPVSVIRHDTHELSAFRNANTAKRLELSRIMKISSIERFRKKHMISAFISGIRRDEHDSRSKEQYFSQRQNHMRIHPILDFTEKDIWEYIKIYTVPYVSLYDKGYRSLGEKPFTRPVGTSGSERSGREPDKERLMERLRAMGYW